MKIFKFVSVTFILGTIFIILSLGQPIYATDTIKKAPIGKSDNNTSIITINENEDHDKKQDNSTTHFQLKSFSDILKTFRSDTNNIKPIYFKFKPLNITNNNTSSTKQFIFINKFKSFSDIVQEPIKTTTSVIESSTVQHLTLRFVSFLTNKVIKSNTADRLIIAINNINDTEEKSEISNKSTQQPEKNDQQIKSNQDNKNNAEQTTTSDQNNTGNPAKNEASPTGNDENEDKSTNNEENNSTKDNNSINDTDKDTNNTNSTEETDSEEDTNGNIDNKPEPENSKTENTPKDKNDDTEQQVSENINNTPSKSLGKINLISSRPSTQKFYKKVLVISYEPTIDNKNIIDYYHWNNPRSLTNQIIANIKEASHGIVNYTVVDNIRVQDFPVKNDGFKYTAESYKRCITNNDACHQPDIVNYPKILTQFDICQKVNNDEIDEVWLFGGPYFGFKESAIAGKKGLRYNSLLIYTTKCKKSIVVMGFNYERHLTEAIHSYSHRIESTMQQVYGGWNQNSINNNWNKFSLVKYLASNYNYSTCGNVHFPPNGTYDYDYSNKLVVLSHCDSWFGNDTGPKYINCDKWGCTHLGYLDWWMQHIPYGNKDYGDSVNDNWWYYIADPNKALQD